MLNILGKVQDLIELVRNGIIYDETVCDMRSRMLKVNDALVALSCAPQEAPKVAQRFCVRLKGYPLWVRHNDVDGRYVDVPERYLFCIDGFWTESKIFAIKELRTLDGIGLRDAKDIVDALQVHAIDLDTLSQRASNVSKL